MSDSVSSPPARIRAAAIQLEGVPGRVDVTLARLEALITEAGERGARIIAVPEFCTSPVPMRAEVHAAVLPRENVAVEMFRRLAARFGATIGGSMLIADDDAGDNDDEPNIFNRYHLVEPDGSIHTHDKDLPTMWENCFYTGGNPASGDQTGGDDGAFDTALGGVGVASCWELIRSQTARRLLGRVDFAMTGTHWWTVPSNWGGLTSRALRPIAERNRSMSENAPVEFARRLGVPVIQASHCGSIRSDFLLLPGSNVSIPYETEFVGATQIVSADGTVLASRNTAEGPGIVYADIEIGAQAGAQCDAQAGARRGAQAGAWRGAVKPVTPIEERFWIPDLPLLVRGYWHQQNLAGRSYYTRTGRAAGLAAAKGAT